MDNHLCIRLRHKDMPTISQILTQFLIVVNLSIENNPHRPVFITDRLVPCVEIDNRQSPKAKTDRSGPVVSFIVRSTVPNGIRH